MGVSEVSENRNRAVFLDRDGVINRPVIRNGKPYPPATVEELEIPPDVPGALARLKSAGFFLIGVTNQPDVARGAQRREVVEAIHASLLRDLPLDEILTCYHDDPDDCWCRKPRPGLLLAAAARYNVDAGSSFMVGDRWRDVEAGRNAGCRTVFIECGYAEKSPEHLPDLIVRSLAEAVDWILDQ
jgi:D-glycero-D-manno-heptose 1,7-bisphosphate phosphatase